ncbi:MAG: FtsL-like putative cell division protein [Bacteroidota bacterium]
MGNRIRSEEQHVASTAGVGDKKAGSSRFIRLMYAFGIFSKEGLVKSMPFVFFLMAIALLYIANSYEAERVIRDIDKTGKELKALRTEYISVKSELMFTSKQSEVARMSSSFGISESKSAPMKIVVADNSNQESELTLWEKLKRIFS